MNLTSGPSSWDRDMQGMPGMDEEESENLAALGMHITGDDKKKDEEEEDEEEVKVKDDVIGDDAVKTDEDEKEEDEELEEVDELKALDILAKKLKEEDAPTMVDEEE